MAIAEELSDLYAAPLADFTKARNELASKLLEQGRKDEAAQVKALKKPSISAWATNQLARKKPDQVGLLVETQQRLQEGIDAQTMRDASSARRKVVAALLASARDVLTDADHPASSTTLAKVEQTLLSATSDRELEMLQQGRLTGDLVSPGFDAIEGFEMLASEPPKSDQRARKRAEELAQVATAAEREAAEARAEAERLLDAAESTRKAAERAARAAERAERDAEKARAKADRALDG
jgi:hypothetical protein